MTVESSNVGRQCVISLDSSVLLNLPRKERVITTSGTKLDPYMREDVYLLDFYNVMCDMVAAGALTFPIEVVDESKGQPQDDLARAFTQKAWQLNDRNLRKPSEAHLARVINMAFASEVGLTQKRMADPRVIAIALTQLLDHNRLCLVATEDKTMIQCCENLDIRVLSTRDFIASVLSWRDRTAVAS